MLLYGLRIPTSFEFLISFQNQLDTPQIKQIILLVGEKLIFWETRAVLSQYNIKRSILYLWSCRAPACRTQSRRCYQTGCGTPPGSCSGAGSWQWGWSCCRHLLAQSAWARGSRGCWWSARWLCCLLRWGHLSLEPPCYWWSGAGHRGGGKREKRGEEPWRERARRKKGERWHLLAKASVLYLAIWNTGYVARHTRLWQSGYFQNEFAKKHDFCYIKSNEQSGWKGPFKNLFSDTCIWKVLNKLCVHTVYDCFGIAIQWIPAILTDRYSNVLVVE